MGRKSMGYEGLLYYGAKGSQASTLIDQRVNVEYEMTPEIGNTTHAGDGTTVPIATGEATVLTPSITFNMIVDANSTAIVALLAAAATGGAIALRFIRSSGKLGFDCDCILSATQGAPLNGEQTIDFTVEAVSDSDRDPILNG